MIIIYNILFKVILYTKIVLLVYLTVVSYCKRIPLRFLTTPPHPRLLSFDGSVSSASSGDSSSAKPPVMAKLIVSCSRSAGGSSNAQWVYYLKGINT